MLYIKRYSSEKIFNPICYRLKTYNDEGTETGYIEIAPVGNRLIKILHTVVRPEFRGGKVGRNLINLAVEEAHNKGAKLLSSCSYAAHLLEKMDLSNICANAEDLVSELKKEGHPEKSDFIKRSLNIKAGGYGEKDKILSVSMPQLRQKEQLWGPFTEDMLRNMLKNEYHEIRMLASVSLTEMYKKGRRSLGLKESILNIYKDCLHGFNNWDLIDLSSPYIIGEHSLHSEKAEKLLLQCAASDRLWERRIGIVSTLGRIRSGEFSIAEKVIASSLSHEHHLIHKANGWMLREIGKKDKNRMISFIKRYRDKMPSVTFSYATERLTKEEKIKVGLTKPTLTI